MKNFDGIIYFKPDSTDQWGDPTMIEHDLLLKLDTLRMLTHSPIHVTSGYRTTSSGAKNSQHFYGRAADVICPGISLGEFYRAAEKVGFTGLGVYPAWRYDGKIAGGLHCDVRPGMIKARWMGVLHGNEQIYIELNEENLRKYKVIL